ncbi:hypothetical protein [Gordonia aurantiaca]|uniref:hypothetical protein n=1 Tax=Gordonia sp. B21 TaxID=3151852 RepID=UPI0032645952
MTQFIKSLDRKVINTTFGIIYGFALLMALFPPLYLSASGARGPVILGIPWSVMYWIVNAALVGVALSALYIVENIRGEGDD